MSLTILNRPQNAFLLLGFLFGLAMVFLTPPGLVGDEPNHFFRAYQIADGTLIGIKHEGHSGGWIPESVFVTNRQLVGEIEMNHHIKFDTDLIWRLREMPLDEERKVFVPFYNTVVYSPVPYLPQVIGILLGKSFGASAITLIYFARVFNLLSFLALSYLAIILTPAHKWTFTFLWLTPTTVFQAASASVDAFTFGICFFTISGFLYFAFDGNAVIEWPKVAGLGLICVLAVLTKQAYILLPLLFLTIPSAKFGRARDYYLVLLALVFVCIGAVASWSVVVKPIFMPYRGDVPIDADTQLQLILGDPLGFLNTVMNSYVLFYKYYFVTFFGQLTWLDLFVPKWLTVFLFAIVIGFALLDKAHHVKISLSDKIVFAGIVAGTLLVISSLLYLTWSPVGADRIAGIQGRYFIPVAPLFFLLMFNHRLRWMFLERRFAIVCYLTVSASLLITLYTILHRYYI